MRLGRCLRLQVGAGPASLMRQPSLHRCARRGPSLSLHFLMGRGHQPTTLPADRKRYTVKSF